MKKLSILIPTFNRCDYLKITLTHLLPQIERHLQDIELVICSNASTDGTEEYVKDLQQKKKYINYYYFENFVEICDSFSRSIGKTTGEYVIIWGDDDIPCLYTIDYILKVLKENENVGIFHFNNMTGYDHMEYMSTLRVNYDIYDSPCKKMNLHDFLIKYAFNCGLITTFAFYREAWEKGLPYHSKEDYGYEFLPIIFNGIKGMDCIYCSFPLAIQRMPLTRVWLNRWPLYRAVGAPNMLKSMERSGLTEGAYVAWKNKYFSFKTFLKVSLVAAQFRKEYKKRGKEMTKYMSPLRKIVFYVVLYCWPAFITRALRNQAHKQ